MSTAAPSTPHRSRRRDDQGLTSRRWGWVSIISGVIALTGFLWTWSYSVSDVDPVPWLRIPLILLLPLGLIAATLSAVIAWRGAGRRLAWIGLGVSAAVLAAFIVMLNVMG